MAHAERDTPTRAAAPAGSLCPEPPGRLKGDQRAHAVPEKGIRLPETGPEFGQECLDHRFETGVRLFAEAGSPAGKLDRIDFDVGR